MNWVLENPLSWYGLTNNTAPISSIAEVVFPIQAKCSFRDFGVAGSGQVHDAICILSLNTLNQKLFFILWFWYIFLTAMSFLAVVYRIALILFPMIRIYLLMVQTRNIKVKDLRYIINNLAYGNFFVLYNIGKNVNPISYQDLVLGVRDQLKITNQSKNDKSPVEV